jgi:hypothetical protein
MEAIMADKAKPVHKLRSGAIEVSVWKNEGKNGTWYSVTHRRSYKQGDNWKDSDRYGEDDLLPLAKLLDLAHTWIISQPPGRKQQAA